MTPEGKANFGFYHREKSQWLNIRRELGASNLSLNTEAVCTLITQAALQVGCKGSTELRLAHSILDEPHFTLGLLATVNSSFASIGTYSSLSLTHSIVRLATRIGIYSTESTQERRC